MLRCSVRYTLHQKSPFTIKQSMLNRTLHRDMPKTLLKFQWNQLHSGIKYTWDRKSLQFAASILLHLGHDARYIATYT